MLVIRLSRTGKKSQPSFKIVVQEKTAAVKGKFIEELGYYKPAITPKVFVVKMDKIKAWIKNGAHPSDSLAVLLKKEGLEGMDKYIEPRDKKRKSKKEEKNSSEQEAKAQVTPPVKQEAKAPVPPVTPPVKQEDKAPVPPVTPPVKQEANAPVDQPTEKPVEQKEETKQ